MNLEAVTICHIPAGNFTLHERVFQVPSFYYLRTFRLRRTKRGNLIWSENAAESLFGEHYHSKSEALSAARERGLVLNRKNPDATFYYFKEGDLGS